MSEAPNEIWCDTGLYYDYKTDWSEGSWRNNDNCGGVKYVRADRIEELQSQIEELHYAVTAAHLKGYMDGKQEAEERLKAATDDAKEAEAYAEELEATLRKLEYWFDTDQERKGSSYAQEVLDVMGNQKMIRDALKGNSDG